MRSLGPYLLTHRLGEGGMGAVWMAQRAALGGAAKSVAIKTLLAHRAHDPKSRKMFLDEARLSMLLTNSNIVQVFDVGEADDGTCYMVMEWVDGISLSSLFELSRAHDEMLPAHIIAFIIGEVLKGLAYAHQFEHRGERLTVVHRDVSPHNVMLSVAGEVKLMDFGVARVASEETSGEYVKGKLRYMPPEQLRGDSREPTIDLFAVGAVLHELLDGKKFRRDVDEARLCGMVLAGEVPPLCCPPGRVPHELEVLRRGLLAAKPEDRIPSARAAYRKLAQWSGYRDAKFELEDLVRRFKVFDGTATRVRPQPVPDPPQTTRSETVRTGPLTRSGTARSVAVRGEPVSAPLRAAKFGALSLGVALIFGLFGIGMTLNWWGGDEPPTVAQAEPPTKAPEGPAAPAAPDEEAPSVAAPPPDEVLLVIEDSPSDDPPKPKPKPKSKPESVPVTITAPDYKFWIAIKIDNKQYQIDRMKGHSTAAKIKPGVHKVWFREEPDGRWREAGTIRVPHSGTITLELKSGGKAVVKSRD